MASLILRRSIFQNWICACARPTVRQLSSSAAAAAPWLLIEDKVEEDGGKLFYNFYSLAEKSVKSIPKDAIAKDAIVVGSSHGWLALYKTRLDDSHLDLFLYNPLSRRSINLPSIETLPFPTINTSRISPRDQSNRPTKVILSCSPDDDDEDEDECRAIMSYGPEGKLAVCCPGLGNEWTPMEAGGDPAIDEGLLKYTKPTKFPSAYKDFVYSKGLKQLFCTNKFDNFECWDLRNPLVPKLNWKLGDSKECSGVLKNLVFAEQSNRLFLVQRNVMEQISPDGDKKDKIEPRYMDDTLDGKEDNKIERRYMDDTLDGMSFFIGSTGHGFVVEDQRDAVEPNCIYFTDPKELTPPPPHGDDQEKGVALYGGHDLGVFHFVKETFSPCYYSCDLRHVKRIYPTPTWFTPSPN